jgi:hypothetical protein
MRFVIAGVICLNLYLPYISFSKVLKVLSITSIAASQEKSQCIQSVSTGAKNASNYLIKQTKSYLSNLQRWEAKLQKKHSNIDSAIFSKLTGNTTKADHSSTVRYRVK